MRVLSVILLAFILAAVSACKQTSSASNLPKAESGNTPAGKDSADEPPPLVNSYVQVENRSPVTYTGNSN